MPRIPSSPRPRLDMRDLEVVLAVARSGSTVRASSELHVTQSAASRALLLAEEKLGVPLFERTTRGLAPTAAGKRLIDGASTLLTELHELESRVLMPVDEPVHLRLACECYTAYRWLPSTLGRLRDAMPNLDIAISVEHTGDPVAALLQQELDVGLLTTGQLRGKLEEMPLFSDEIVFLTGMSHPLATKKAITQSDLQEHRLIFSSLTPEPEQRWFTTRVFGRKKSGPSALRVPALRFPLTEAIVDAARAGMGVAVLSEWIALPYLETDDLVLLRLDGRELWRPWRIAFRPEMTAHAQRLRAALEHAAPRAYPRARR